MKLLLASAFVFSLTSSTVPAQSVASGHASNLELRLSPASIEDGIPQVFNFEIVNVGNHDVRVPRPIVDCVGSYTGYIWLRLVFTPMHGAVSQLGGMCGADKVNWPSILKRAQKWTVLRPGESVRQTSRRTDVHVEGREPGMYEFWAEYHPPAIEPNDQKSLHKAGIDFPHEQLTSSHLTFTRKP